MIDQPKRGGRSHPIADQGNDLPAEIESVVTGRERAEESRPTHGSLSTGSEQRQASRTRLADVFGNFMVRISVGDLKNLVRCRFRWNAAGTKAPSSKLQRSSKSQAPNLGTSDVAVIQGRRVEVWGLGASLELGAWDLKLPSRDIPRKPARNQKIRSR